MSGGLKAKGHPVGATGVSQHVIAAMQEAVLLNDGGPRQQDVVRQLLEAGADPDIRDREGRTALQNAERLGFAEIAELIRDRPTG